MTSSIIQPSFASGELTPSLYGRVDLAKWHVGASTMRNFFVNYRGGASSRAGTAFVGFCKQAGTSSPPRFIRFQFSLNQGFCLEFGNLYMRVISDGAYVTETPKNITAITRANPGVVTSASHGFSNGDDVFISGVGGMIQLNSEIYRVANVLTNSFTLKDGFGNAVDTTNFTAYTSGGTVARIYTLVTPYSASDLPALKYTQSADTMSLTHPSYPPYDLVRVAANNWTITQTVFSSVIAAPASATATASVSPLVITTGASTHTNTLLDSINVTTSNFQVGWAVSGTGIPANTTITVIDSSSAVHISNPATGTASITATFTQPSTNYSYVVTAVDATTGEESVASPAANVASVDIAVQLGSITISWSAVSGASSYRIYRAPAAYGTAIPAGSLYGFVGTALGNSFVDSNITPDFALSPPLFYDPFAIGQIISVTITNQGSGYTSAPTVAITTSTGAGFVGSAVVVGGQVQAVIIINAGHGYVNANTVAFTGGGGSSATGTLVVGPQTGTYPSVVAYFQQRRVYADTNNNPDTYFMSQPGAFTNFDSSPLPIDSDAIIGTPWAQQIEGIQALVPMPGGLVVLTGLGAWQVSGGGGSASNPTAITPTSQDATPQAYNGCHDHILPIVINYDILYVQAKGSIVRDLAYNFFVNIYTGTDLSVLSDHLFEGYQILEWAWCEEPYKIIWAVRDDGILLSLTYLKEQEIYGWARHDTNGLFASVAAVTETEVDTLYTAVKRYINGQWLYCAERMNNRLWITLEDSWCLDCALSYPMPTPNATLTASQASMPGLIGSATVVTGGSGYTAPVGFIRDIGGSGSGASVSFTLSAGVITAITVDNAGSNYTAAQLLIQDSTGVGAVGELTLNNNITFTASSAVFGSANVGDIIRMGGGVATVVSVDGTNTIATANLTAPITVVLNDDARDTPVPAASGDWSITTPTQTVYGLNHLEGMTVKALADGSVEDGLVVTGGTVTLSHAASSIVIGLPFTAQLQSLYTDIPGELTVQGKRKNIYAVTVRVQGSRGLKVGSNQVDASTQQNFANVPWTNLVEIKERGNQIFAGNAIPLFTGDERVIIPPTWAKPGQVAVQQDNPLPANVLAFVPELIIGDSNG